MPTRKSDRSIYSKVLFAVLLPGFIVAFSVGVVLLVNVLSLASPSPGHCLTFQNTTLPSTPCEALQGIVYAVNIDLAELPTDDTDKSWLALLFALGGLTFSVLYGSLFLRARRKHAEESKKIANRPSFFNIQPVTRKSLGFVGFLTDSRIVMVVNTGLSTASAAVWLGVVFCKPNEMTTFLRTLHPGLSRSEYIEVLMHYMCRYPEHASTVFHLEAFLTGCLVVSIVLFFMSQHKHRTDLVLALLDTLNCLFVVYSLPMGYYVSSSRAYSLYMLNGFIRTIRTFYGVPAIAQQYDLLVVDPTDKRTANIKIQVSFADRLRLLFGELALGFKVGTFVFSSGLLMIVAEGMACQYQVPAHSACSCPPETAEFVGGMYFIVTVCATVGFGDFAPLTQGGRILIIFVMLCGAYQLPDWLDHLKAHRTNRMLTKKLSIIQHNASRNDGTLSRKGAGTIKRSQSSRDRLIRMMKRGDSKENNLKRTLSNMSANNGSLTTSTSTIGIVNLAAGDRGSLRGSMDMMAGVGIRPGMATSGRLGMGAKIVGNLADVSGLMQNAKPETAAVVNTTTPVVQASDSVNLPPTAAAMAVTTISEEMQSEFSSRGLQALSSRKSILLEEAKEAVNELQAEEQAQPQQEEVDERGMEREGTVSEKELEDYIRMFHHIEANNQRLRHNSLALQAVVYGLCSSLNAQAAEKAHDLQHLRSTALC
eukprot:c39179_g1_i1.p1 GENE.c39179_g1_i1~~c39179_g1_i1.p1  ORF type:complete len:706 (-),score=156.90 c39179_g1_i1:145-2262(-)